MEDMLKFFKDAALKDIKNKSTGWHVFLTQADLLEKDENGKCLLEYALEYDAPLDLDLNSVFHNSLEVLYLLDNYKKFEEIKKLPLTEEQLFSDYYGIPVIEYLIRSGICNNHNITAIKHHPEILDIIRDSDESLYRYLSKELIDYLATKEEDGIYPLELYITYDELIETIVSKIDNPKALVDLYDKYGDDIYMKKVNVEAATTPINGGATILEYLLDNSIYADIIENIPCNKKLIDELIRLNYSHLLQYVKEDKLLQEIEEGVTLLQYIIENTSINSFDETFLDDRTIKILYQMNKLDSIHFKYNPGKTNQFILVLPEGKTTTDFLIEHNADFELKGNNVEAIKSILKNKYFIALPHHIELEEFIDLEEFEYLLDAIKNREVVYKLEDLTLYQTNDVLAKLYILLAKKDMLSLVSELTTNDLLTINNGTTLLEELLKRDKETTINDIIYHLKRDPKIAALLKVKGIKIGSVDIANRDEEVDEYMEKIGLYLGMGPQREEGMQLLKELEDIFKADGRSDPELIDLLVLGYSQGLINYYDMVLSELKNLITIKQYFPDFIYVKDPDGYFDSSSMEIHSSATIEVLMHETGHALHYFLTNFHYEDDYNEIITKLRDDPKTMDRLLEFTKIVRPLKDEVEDEAIDMVDRIGIRKNNEIYEFLLSSKEKKKEELRDVLNLLNIDEETIDSILSEIYTVKEYEHHKERIIIAEIKERILRNKHSVYITISDIFDAIYKGKFFSGSLVDPDGVPIDGWYGHGQKYFSNESNGFDELVAEYSSILKSPNSAENLEILRRLIGDELYDLISNFYFDNIVNRDLNQEYETIIDLNVIMDNNEEIKRRQ